MLLSYSGSLIKDSIKHGHDEKLWVTHMVCELYQHTIILAHKARRCEVAEKALACIIHNQSTYTPMY
jgi:hypothetical protein